MPTELGQVLADYEREGLITPAGRADVETHLSGLVDRRLLAPSVDAGYLDGGRRVQIASALSAETAEAVSGLFVAQIEPVSLRELLADEAIRAQFGVVFDIPGALDEVPPETQLVLDPARLTVPGTNNQMPRTQRERSTLHSQQVQQELGRDDIGVFWFKGLSSAIAQAELQFRQQYGEDLWVDRRKGEPFYVRTPDRATGAATLDMGRGKPEYRLTITHYDAASSPYVHAPRVLVPTEPLLLIPPTS